MYRTLKKGRWHLAERGDYEKLKDKKDIQFLSDLPYSEAKAIVDKFTSPALKERGTEILFYLKDKNVNARETECRKYIDFVLQNIDRAVRCLHSARLDDKLKERDQLDLERWELNEAVDDWCKAIAACLFAYDVSSRYFDERSKK